MRWFWLFILGLVLLTGTLYAVRVRSSAANAPIAQEPEETQSRPSRRSRSDRGTESEQTQPETKPVIKPETKLEPERENEPKVDIESPELQASDQPDDQPIEDTEVEDTEDPVDTPSESASESAAETGTDTSSGTAFDALIEKFVVQRPARSDRTNQSEQSEQAEPIEDEFASLSQSEPVDENEPAEDESAPSYELLGNGSFRVLGTNTVVKGAGSAVNPFVLDWDTLRSVENSYNPKKGQDQLPDWLNLLDQKHVQIEGNTLVPVIATTTRELLVMKNPWDGCCIGIPPSPYDAIEVILDHDVDFGNSAVGFGQVEGVFYLDPYVVDGWVLGLFIIEDAQYRSGEGITFPDY